MVGVGAGAHGALGASQIAWETVILRRVNRNKKRAPDAGSTATAEIPVVLLSRTRSEE